VQGGAADEDGEGEAAGDRAGGDPGVGAGSAAQVLLAWEEGGRMHRGLRGAKFTATTLARAAEPAEVRNTGDCARFVRLGPGNMSPSTQLTQ
jgi:hypothetical protein